MQKDGKVIKKDDKRRVKDLREEVAIFSGQKQHIATLFKMPLAFSNMFDNHPQQISTAWHRIKLTSQDTSPVHKTTYQVGPKSRQFTAIEIGKKLKQVVMEASTTDWVSPIKMMAHSVFV